jgi:hypothetical protein
MQHRKNVSRSRGAPRLRRGAGVLFRSSDVCRSHRSAFEGGRDYPLNNVRRRLRRLILCLTAKRFGGVLGMFSSL